MTNRALQLVGGDMWSKGVAKFVVQERIPEGLLVVGVRCRLADSSDQYLALLDTGAQYSVIGGEYAELVASQVHKTGGCLTMQTRLGKVEGDLCRMTITLIADDGDDLSVDSTVLLCPEWDGPLVFGYMGLLDRLRIALDPCGDGGDWFYFGKSA